MTVWKISVDWSLDLVPQTTLLVEILDNNICSINFEGKELAGVYVMNTPNPSVNAPTYGISFEYNESDVTLAGIFTGSDRFYAGNIAIKGDGQFLAGRFKTAIA
jgi:hypothetical protein